MKYTLIISYCIYNIHEIFDDFFFLNNALSKTNIL